MEKEAGDYYSRTNAELFRIFGSSGAGLSEKEVESGRKKYGYNQLKRKRSGMLVFLRQFKSPLTLLLIVTSIISMFFGEMISALIILAIIALTSLFSFIQEYRSEKIVEDLNRKISHKTIVIRNNEKIEIDTSNLVPGDIVVLNIGDKVPADIRILESKNLEINEAILTGESMPVHKISEIIRTAEKLQDFKNYAFAGTIVSNGDALGIVIATGEKTQIGEMSKQAVKERPETEFQHGIKKFVNLLIYIVAIAAAVIFLANFILRHNFLDSLLFSLAIAIGIAPEMLPVIITLGLSKGARIMSKNQVIVKRLVSIEDFGNMDILCTDKTGTLTEGNIKVYSHVDFTGKNNDNVLLYGILCNSAAVHGKKFFGNPIDVAILQHEDARIKERAEEFSKIDEIPFDYTRKRMSVIVRKGKEQIMITKGASRLMLKICSSVYVNGKTTGISPYSKKIEEKFMELSNQGLRVVAVAYKKAEKKSYSSKDEKGMTFLGFLALSDPPKKTIRESLEKMKSLNIDFKILTGDNEVITQKIARDVGLPVTRIVLGDEVDKYNDAVLGKTAEEANIFCRLTPSQKQRIIKILKNNGHDVGYMGDGVNDVDALHEADVGISVDSAVDVAKDASDIILLKKSLIILAQGVTEGRKIFSNSMKYIMIGVSSDFGNMISMSLASFFLSFLPMLPPQILLNDLLYDVSQMPVANDNVDAENLKKPKKFNLELIKKFMIWFGPISSLYDIATFVILIFILKASEITFRTGWFLESIATQTLVFFVIRTRKSPFWKSMPGKWVLASCLGVVAAAFLIPFTPLGEIFGFAQMPAIYFAYLVIVIAVYIIMAEIGKRIFFRRYEI